tara:strand:- start:2511 stop:3263 length:753 start_codon:yes stop_codon:yes gene_type:complete
MKIAFIQPINHLAYDVTDYHMCLTHLVLKYPEYMKFYRQKSNLGDYLILDNSLIELGQSVELSTVLRAAKYVMPSEIVLPDKFLDKAGTLNAIDKSLERLRRPDTKMLRYKFQAVCHGQNAEEWKECWDALQEYDEIHCIGIPKVTTTIFNDGRPEAVRYALNNNLANKEIHLLGVWEDITELKEYNVDEASKIRGVDSSIVFHSTVENFSYLKNQTKKPEYKIDLVKNYTINGKLLLENQQQVLQWIQN